MLEDRHHPRAPNSALTARRNVRTAISEVVQRLDRLHRQVAFISAKADVARSEIARRALLEDCAKVDSEVLALRTALIVDLMDAEPAVKHHSRVVDVEK